jgi:membrane-associated protein
MEWLTTALELVLHLDRHLGVWVAHYGVWVYGLLFAIVFAETGLVVTPFLPGDSLLFVAGSLAALGSLDVHFLVAALFAAAVIGNVVNYEIGRWVSPWVFSSRHSRWLNRKHLDDTHLFFERWGAAAIVVARFIPFLRTYVPFVAGLGRMTRSLYVLFTALGAALWVGSLVYAGYFFGNIPWIKANLGLLVIGIVLLSTVPVGIAAIKARQTRQENLAHSASRASSSRSEPRR